MASGALRPRGLKSPVVGQVQDGRCLAAGVLLSPMQWLWPCVTRGTRRGPVLAGSVWSLVSNAQAGKGKVKEAAWEDPAGPLRGKGLAPPPIAQGGARLWVPPHLAGEWPVSHPACSGRQHGGTLCSA